MTRARVLLLLACCFFALASVPYARALTGPGPGPNDLAGGDGVAEPGENTPPQSEAPAPASDEPVETPSANTAIPGVGSPTTSDAPTPGQPEGEELPDQMLSPKGMVELFLSEAGAVYTQNEADPAILLKYLPRSVREAFDNAGLRDARRLAQSLLEIERRQQEEKAGSLRMFDLPINESGALFVWTVNVGTVERPDDRDFTLVKGPRGYWRFTEGAIENARTLHAELFADSSEYLLRTLFERMGLTVLIDRELVGIGLYQWVSLAALIFVAWVLDLVIALVFQLVVRRYLKKDEDARTPGDSSRLVRKASKPFGLAAGGAFVYFMLPALDFNPTPEGILRVAAQIVTLVGLFLSLSRAVDLAAEFFQRRAIKTPTKFDDLLVPLIRKSAKTVLLVFALLTVAESLSLPVTSLLAGLGIAGAAIAFASKDTVENFFGSIAVILDRPFNAGDWVAIDGIEGTVEHLGFRSTRIRTFYNSLITVPNALLVRAKVDNYGMRKYRRYKTTLQILYSTPPDRIEAFVEGLRELVRTSPDTRKDTIEIHFRDLGAHSLDIMVYIFFRVPDWSAELAARHTFNLQVLRLAKRLGVEFAYPTQTLEVRRVDPLEEPGPSRDTESSREAGIEAAKSVRSSQTLD